MDWTCSTHEREMKNSEISQLKNRKGSDHSEDLGVGGKG
jgi:hypothetical protein